MGAGPVHEVGEHLLGRMICPLGIVDHDDARRRASRCRHRPSHAVQEPSLGPRPSRRLVLVDRAELGHQPDHRRGARVRERGEPRRRRGIGRRQAQQLDEGAVRDVPVVLVAAHHERGCSSPGEDLLDETGLAHARLAVHDDDPTGSDRRVEGGHLTGPTGERVATEPGGDRGAVRGSGHRGHVASGDGVVERRRLFQRGDAELLVHGAHARSVLVDRGAPVPSLRVEAHEGPVRGFVQRVEVEPALGVIGGLVDPTLGGERVDETGGGGGQRPTKSLRLAHLPFVERGAVAQREAGQQIASPQRRGGSHLLDVSGGQPGEELSHVDRDAVAVQQGDLVTGDAQASIGEALLDDRQGPAEGGAGAGLVRVGPEQGGKGLAPLRLIGHRQVGEQRGGLAGVELDRGAAALDARRSEHRDDDVSGSRSPHHAPTSRSRCTPPGPVPQRNGRIAGRRNDLGTPLRDAPAMTSVIEISGLRKEYRHLRGRRQVAIDGLDLEVPEGGVFGFLGPNGSGKTTTIRCLLGLARPTAGSCRLLGVATPADVGTVIRRVGAIVETPALFPTMTGRRNLRLLARRRGSAPRRWTSCWIASVSRSAARTWSAPTRSACGSASAWPRRCSRTLRCSSSTSPPTASTRPASRRSVSCSARSATRAAPCSSPATSSWRSSTRAIGSPSCRKAGAWPQGR